MVTRGVNEEEICDFVALTKDKVRTYRCLEEHHVVLLHV